MQQMQPDIPWTRKPFSGLRLGLFLHYVYFDPERDYYWGPLGRHQHGPATTLDDLADGLDVEDIASSAEAMGAEYVIFTAWHADMNLMYPSAVMAHWRPGHAARRDVIGDLLAALHARGIELMLYVHPSDGHDFPEADAAALGWQSPPYTRWRRFITEIFTELTFRYRGQLLGYWVDGGTPPQIDGALDQLYGEVKALDPGMVVVQNEGLDENSFRRWADDGCREWINPPYPSTDLQSAAVITGAWWAESGLLLWTPELAYRNLVLQAATMGHRGGGVAYSTGPYTGGAWEPGVPEFFAALGRYARGR